MDKENFNPLVYDSRMSEIGIAQDSTFASVGSPMFPPPAATKTEKKFANIAHGSEPDDKMTKLTQENFDLRLHCYHLREKLNKVTNSADVSADLNRVAYLESRVDSLTRDLESKMLLLTQGSEALAQLDEQLSAARRERDDAEARCAEMRARLDAQSDNNNAGESMSAASAAGVASTSSATAAAAVSERDEQRVLKMAGLLQTAWTQQRTLEAKLAKACAERDSLRQLESQAAVACSLTDRVAELNRELAGANAALAQAGETIEALRQQVSEGRSEIDELNQILGEYQEEVEKLNAEKIAAASAAAAAGRTAASSMSSSSRGAAPGGGDAEGSFWESVRLGGLRDRQQQHQLMAASAGAAAASGGSVGGVSALVEGLGALSLMPPSDELLPAAGGPPQMLRHPRAEEISAEARQCLDASGRRFYHLCVTSLASSGAAGAVGAVGQVADVEAELSVSELTGPGLMAQVSQLRAHSLPMSMDAAAGMSPGELCQLKNVFDRLLGQLRGAEAGLQAALSTTLGNVSAAALAGLTQASIREDSFAGCTAASAFNAVGAAPGTPGLRSMEEENALAMRNLQEHVAEVRMALTDLGRVGVMLEAMLTGAVAEASRMSLDDLGGHPAAAARPPLGPSAASTLTEVTTCTAASSAAATAAAATTTTAAEDFEHAAAASGVTEVHDDDIMRPLRMADLLPLQPAQPLPQAASSVPSALTTPNNNALFESCTSRLSSSTSTSSSAAAAAADAALRREVLRLGEQLGVLESAKAALERENRRLRADVDAAVTAAAASEADADAESAARCRALEAELGAAVGRCEALAAELQAALDEGEQAHAEARELAVNCDALRAEMAGLAEANDDLRKQAADLAAEKANLEALTANLAAEKATLLNASTEAAIAVHSEKSRESSLPLCDNVTDAKATELEEKAAELEVKAAELAHAKAELEEKADQLAKARQDLEDKVAEMARVNLDLDEKAAGLSAAKTELEEKAAQLAKAEAELEQRATQLAEAEAGLEEKSVQLASAEASAQEKAAQLVEAETELAEKAAQLAKAEAGLEEKYAQLASTEASAQEKAAQLVEAEAGLAEKAAQLASSEAELEQKAAHLVEAEAELDERAAQLANAEVELEEKASQVTEVESELDEKSAQLANSEAIAQEKAAQLARIEAELEEKAAQLASAESDAQEKAALIAKAEAAVVERAALLDQAEAAAQARADAELAELRAELSALRDERGEARVQAEAARAEAGAVQAELSCLQAEIDRLRVGAEITAAAAASASTSAPSPSPAQRQLQQQHLAEMAEVLARYRELTASCERAILKGGELQSQAEELRAKLSSRSKRLDAALKANGQLKAMLKKSDETCNQLSLQLEATKLEIEEKTALTEKLLRHISRLGGLPQQLLQPSAAAANTTAVDDDSRDSQLDDDEDVDEAGVTGASLTMEAARACGPTPAAEAAAAAASAWPEVAQAEITLHEALTRVVSGGARDSDGRRGSADTAGLARELRRALRDLRHLRERLGQSLADSRRLADRLAEADGRAEEVASLRRRLDEARRAAAVPAGAAAAECPPQSACCRLDCLVLLRREVAECRQALDRAVDQPAVMGSHPAQRELASAASSAAAAARLLAEAFWTATPSGEEDVNSAEASALAAAKAESLGLSRQCAAMRDRLLARAPPTEFSDRLSCTEALLADAKQRLRLAELQRQQLLEQQHNASV